MAMMWPTHQEKYVTCKISSSSSSSSQHYITKNHQTCDVYIGELCTFIIQMC